MSQTPGSIGNVLAQLRAFNVVFLHVGTLFGPDRVLAAVLDELAARGESARQVDLGGAPEIEAEPGETLVVTGFDDVAASERKCELLGNARAWGVEQMQRGASLLLFSRVPKLALLGCAGSQLVTDAKAVFLHPWSEEEHQDALRRAEVPESAHEAVIRFGGGLPELSEALVAVSSTGLSPADERARAAEQLTERIAAAVDELGWNVAVALEDRLAREQATDFDADRDDPLVVEALRGSGLLAVSEEGRGQLLSSRLRSHAIEGVRRTLDDVVVPPRDVKEIIGGLWEIERRVRVLVGQQARAQHGRGWRASLLDAELGQRVVDRVERETALPVGSVAQVPNPLEWLTMDELLGLFLDARAPLPDRFPHAFWVRMRHELVPVRNRSAHFRLPDLGDSETVRRWRGELIRRLGAEAESA